MSQIDQKRVVAIDAYFRACNYLSVGQLYLGANPLLRVPLRPEHIKKRIIGHWGTSPGLNLIYAHLNRLIKDTDARILLVVGPGHGAPAIRANLYLEGALGEVDRRLALNTAGIGYLFRGFCWPREAPSHVCAATPGAIHEGGELGYSLSHAYGAVFDNPELISVCVVGDGEAETGPLAASWHSNRFIHPQRDGAVLPILHLNGYKISSPTVFGRMSRSKLEHFFRGCGYTPRFVEGDNPELMHVSLWKALDWAYHLIRLKKCESPAETLLDWPIIILRTPKGWTGPKLIDGQKSEGSFRSHQVPMPDVASNSEHLNILNTWLQSYQPEGLFDSNGKPSEEVLNVLPISNLRIGANPHANGGKVLKELQLPKIEDYAVELTFPGKVTLEGIRGLSAFLRDVIKANKSNFRVFCPDELSSNRLSHILEVTGRMYLGKILESDEGLSPEGRVLEVLSEHLCEGWLEGYLLTGRHGIFPCYEAFSLIVDSMLNQHGKWLKSCGEVPWRHPISSLNYLLTSYVWRQDHNGYSHQAPGFIESVIQKKSSISRIFLPPDENCLLQITADCLQSKNYINLIIAGKQPMPQWLTFEQARLHCQIGVSIWDWASNEDGDPDVIMACAGDTPTLEVLAAISSIRNTIPAVKIRVINVVNLFTLLPDDEHPQGISDVEFESLFGRNIPVVFAFHGHPRVIHGLIYRRPNPRRFLVRGYIEEGGTTTPFDMVVFNEMSRFHLAIDVAKQAPVSTDGVSELISKCQMKIDQHLSYIDKYGEDLPEIRNWCWSS
ncbi:phosphoketolase [Microbulbifer sp. A4B17]|nr:phosphoketolase [Microbulbifer sp. A4B17]